MTYRECLDYFHKLSVHRNIDGLQDDTYFQFDVIGRDSGHFYIHLKDGTLEVISGEYKQRNVQFSRYNIQSGTGDKWSNGSDLCIC